MEVLNRCLEAMMGWLKANKLSFHLDKIEMVLEDQGAACIGHVCFWRNRLLAWGKCWFLAENWSSRSPLWHIMPFIRFPWYTTQTHSSKSMICPCWLNSDYIHRRCTLCGLPSGMVWKLHLIQMQLTGYCWRWGLISLQCWKICTGLLFISRHKSEYL